MCIDHTLQADSFHTGNKSIGDSARPPPLPLQSKRNTHALINHTKIGYICNIFTSLISVIEHPSDEVGWQHDTDSMLYIHYTRAEQADDWWEMLHCVQLHWIVHVPVVYKMYNASLLESEKNNIWILIYIDISPF